VRYVNAGNPPGTVGTSSMTSRRATSSSSTTQGDDCTVWGDILTAMAHARNVAGTVIDGVNRDVARALQLSYPIYSKGRYMRTGKDRVEVSDVGRPVSVGGLQVAPGDPLIGDADGVIRVPAALEVRAAEICAVIAASEEKIVADVLSGVSLAEARRRHGYHLLQRKQSQA
jgi:4-hydroxy-4-methyl-2-oxoglutarate aldolase